MKHDRKVKIVVRPKILEPFYEYLKREGFPAKDMTEIIAKNLDKLVHGQFPISMINANKGTINAMQIYNKYTSADTTSDADNEVSDTDSYYSAIDDLEPIVRPKERIILSDDPVITVSKIKARIRPDPVPVLAIRTRSEDPAPHKIKAKLKANIEAEHRLGKLALLVMPGQGGKTSVIINYVLSDFEKVDTSIPKRHHVVVFVSDKNLALNEQTRLRVEQEAHGRVVKSLASKYERGQGYKDLNGVLKNINHIDVLCCCHHYTRWEDIRELMYGIAGRGHTMSVVVDECDVTAVTPVSRPILKILIDHICVNNIYMMTATPTESLIDSFGVFDLIPVPKPVHVNYVTLDNMLHEEIPAPLQGYKYTAVGYVAAVLSDRSPVAGDVWFVPAEPKVESHDEMRDMLFAHGFNIVILINGKEKSISIQDDIDIDIMPEHYGITEIKSWKEGKMELKDIIAKIHNTYPELSIGITGNLCESRGITIQSVSCMIDYGVFSHACASTEAQIYQLICRLLGPLKTFDAWKEGRRPMIICPTSFLEEAIRGENLVLNICKRSTCADSKLDIVDFRGVKAQSGIDGKLSFKQYLSETYKNGALSSVTIENYVKAVNKYSYHKVGILFPSDIIDSFDAMVSDKKQISNAMRRYNEFVLTQN
jgi:hypothetical protein